MKEIIHLGDFVSQKLEEKGLKPQCLAKKLCCTPNNVYKILQRDYIPPRQLVIISDFLNFNFFAYYSYYSKQVKIKEVEVDLKTIRMPSSEESEDDTLT